MTDLKDLVEKVKNLEKLTAEEQPQQIKLLQEIGKELLTEYVIKVGDITIKPLWVEAYYSDANTGFVDTSVHGDECQKQYDVLYFHHKTDDPRPWSGYLLIMWRLLSFLFTEVHFGQRRIQISSPIE